jgi:hypothetical protein
MIGGVNSAALETNSTVAVSPAAQPSHETDTVLPMFTRASIRSGTKKRTLRLASGRSETTGWLAATSSPGS